jgi:hypothetical protein
VLRVVEGKLAAMRSMRESGKMKVVRNAPFGLVYVDAESMA